MGNSVKEILINKFISENSHEKNQPNHHVESSKSYSDEFDELVCRCDKTFLASIPDEYKDEKLGLIYILRPYLALENAPSKLIKDAGKYPRLAEAFLNNRKALSILESSENQFLLLLQTLSLDKINQEKIFNLGLVKTLLDKLNQKEHRIALFKNCHKFPKSAKILFSTYPALYSQLDFNELLFLAATQEFVADKYLLDMVTKISLRNCIIMLSAHSKDEKTFTKIFENLSGSILFQLAQIQDIGDVHHNPICDYDDNIRKLGFELLEILSLPEKILQTCVFTRHLSSDIYIDALNILLESEESITELKKIKKHQFQAIQKLFIKAMKETRTKNNNNYKTELNIADNVYKYLYSTLTKDILKKHKEPYKKNPIVRKHNSQAKLKKNLSAICARAVIQELKDDPTNLLTYVLNRYLKNDKFCREKLGEWISTDTLPSDCKKTLSSLLSDKLSILDKHIYWDLLTELWHNDKNDKTLLSYILTEIDSGTIVSLFKQLSSNFKEVTAQNLQILKNAGELYTSDFYNILLHPVIQNLSNLLPLKNTITTKIEKYIKAENFNLETFEHEVKALLFKKAKPYTRAKKNKYNNFDNTIYDPMSNYIDHCFTDKNYTLVNLRIWAGSKQNYKTLLHWFATTKKNPLDTNITRSCINLFNKYTTFSEIVNSTKIEPETANLFLSAFLQERKAHLKWPTNFQETNTVVCQLFFQDRLTIQEVRTLNQRKIALLNHNAVFSYHKIYGYKSFCLDSLKHFNDQSIKYYPFMSHGLIKNINFDDSIQTKLLDIYENSVLWNRITQDIKKRIGEQLCRAEDFFQSPFYIHVISPNLNNMDKNFSRDSLGEN